MLDLAVDGLKASDNRCSKAQTAAAANGIIEGNGRIRLPGFPSVLPKGLGDVSTLEHYLPLADLQARVLEASRILDRYRSSLRLNAPAPDRHSRQNPKLPGSGDPSATYETGMTRENFQKPLTPLTPSPLTDHLYYKREDLTITKAYKVRGAVVGMAKMLENQTATRFLGVSTGNHALGILKAAELLKPDGVRVVIPSNTSECKRLKLSLAMAKLETLGVEARLEVQGNTFNEARDWAIKNTEPGEYYLDPYGDPWVVAGQGTIGVELLNQLAPLVRAGNYEELLVVSPIGGGGLLTGTATAMKMLASWNPTFKNVNLRFVGLRLLDLESPLGDAIRVTKMEPANETTLRALGVQVAEMSDQDMEAGLGFVNHELGLDVEGASGGTLSPVLFRLDCLPSEKRLVVCLLSGANTNPSNEPAPVCV
ncbi:MAG: pyridoxal-phosphate dependent enzyme [Vampirovibrionales bacterium]|nr:pyridoxal-phosphate dependent enzyme [Vampirovibrionales bacterium]